MVETLTKFRLGQRSFDLFLGSGLQDDPWILCRLPEFGVQTSPEFVRCMVPGPVQVERQLSQRINSLNFGANDDCRPIAHCAPPNVLASCCAEGHLQFRISGLS